VSTYESADDNLKRQAREIAAETKAATEPHLLEDSDIPNLSGATISDLMAKGQLGHLGMGARRHPRRNR
jgi:hypothetical protein